MKLYYIYYFEHEIIICYYGVTYEKLKSVKKYKNCRV